MKYNKIIYFFIVVMSCPSYGGVENFKKNIHNDVVDIAKIIWQWNNPFLIAGLDQKQVEKLMPQWFAQPDNLAQATRYAGANMFLWGLPFMMELAKPTFVHWVSKLKKSEIPPAPVPARDGEEKNKDEEQNGANKVRKQSMSMLDRQTVFLEIAGEPIITSDTMWLPFYTLVRSSVQRTMLEQNNNQPGSQVALTVVADTGIAGAADITYNIIMLLLKKMVSTLEIQNPFNREASWYKDVQSVAPTMIKAAIMFFYQSQATVLINSMKQNKN